MSVTRAILEKNAAPLYSVFGLEYATRVFGQETIDSLSRYTKGDHAGKVRGWIRWRRCTSGGWLREARGVVKPGLFDACIAATSYHGRTDVLRGYWLGDDVTLALDHTQAYEAGRIAEAQRRADNRAAILIDLDQRGDTCEALAKALADLIGGGP